MAYLDSEHFILVSSVVRPPPGECVPRPQLLQHELRPPLPLHVLALLLPAPQLGPDVVEVVEQLPGG